METIKITTIKMDWNNSGAVVKNESGTINWLCPRCSVDVPPGTEHRCGDTVKPARKKRAKSRE